MKPFMRPILRPEKLFGLKFMCYSMSHGAYGVTMEAAYNLWKHGDYEQMSTVRGDTTVSTSVVSDMRPTAEHDER